MKKLISLVALAVISVIISGCEKGFSPVAPNPSAINKILNGDTASTSYWSPATPTNGVANMVFLGNGKATQENILPPQTKAYAHITIILRTMKWVSSTETVSFTVDSTTITSRRVYFVTAQGYSGSGVNDWVIGMKNIDGSTQSGKFSADLLYQSGKVERVTFTLVGG